MSDTNSPNNQDNNQLPQKQEAREYVSVASTILWLIALYIPSVVLGLIFAIYAQSNPNIEDLNLWFQDGDVIATLTILMAICTTPLIIIGVKQQRDKYSYLGLRNKLTWQQLKPWLQIMLVFMIFWWVVNSLLTVEPPQVMQNLTDTTDHFWFLCLAICVVAPIFEELVFRGFIYMRFKQSILGHSGSIILTSIIFTLVHSQYAGIELVAIFSLALLLALARFKTNNLYLCMLLHSLNNWVSILGLLWLAD